MLTQLEVNDITMTLHDNQRSDAPVVLLVHGFPLDHSMWGAQASALAESCRVIAPDLRGYGQTTLGDVGDPPTASMEQYANDLMEMLDKLGVTEPVVYVGFSMGGYTAWQALRNHPQRIRALVLCDTRADADADEARKMRLKMARHVHEWGAERVAEAMLPKLFAASSLDSEHPMIAHTREVISSSQPAAIAAAQRGMAARPDVRDELPNIKIPTLAIVGEEDALSTPEIVRAMAAAIPGAQLEVIPAAGHMAPVEQPDAVSAALLRFVERL